MIKVTLYMRPGCHLCERAGKILRQIGCNVYEVNIDEDPTLLAKYNDLVPVIVAEGVELISGVVDEPSARQVLAPYLHRSIDDR